MLEPIVNANTSHNSHDPSAEEVLLNELKMLEKSDAFVHVRPWIFNDRAKKANINAFTQFALYKCMNEWCSFASDSEKGWKVHMEEHRNLLDTLSKNELINDDYRIKLSKFGECP